LVGHWLIFQIPIFGHRVATIQFVSNLSSLPNDISMVTVFRVAMRRQLIGAKKDLSISGKSARQGSRSRIKKQFDRSCFP
jgi:hypothetical protein